jgi:hypothetical protein
MTRIVEFARKQWASAMDVLLDALVISTCVAP